MFELLSGGLIYSVLKDVWSTIRGRKRSLTPAQIAQSRQKWKKEIEEKLRARQSKGLSTDVIIRDMSRIDNYPNVLETREGISSWFRCGLMGTCHRGVLLGLRWENLVTTDGGNTWQYADDEINVHNITAILIGYVPYENIEAIDWTGDEYYNKPIVYCYFDAHGKESYEKLIYCEQKHLDGFPFYTEITSLADMTMKRGARAGRP